MEIKQLKYFVVAADVGSFSEAAKVLYTTQSSISKVIGALEKELGYSLFQRESKGIALTHEGKKFHSRASKLVADFAALETANLDNPKNMVKISANHSSWLANCFSQFYELLHIPFFEVQLHIHRNLLNLADFFVLLHVKAAKKEYNIFVYKPQREFFYSTNN